MSYLGSYASQPDRITPPYPSRSYRSRTDGVDKQKDPCTRRLARRYRYRHQSREVGLAPGGIPRTPCRAALPCLLAWARVPGNCTRTVPVPISDCPSRVMLDDWARYKEGRKNWVVLVSCSFSPSNSTSLLIPSYSCSQTCLLLVALACSISPAHRPTTLPGSSQPVATSPTHTPCQPYSLPSHCRVRPTQLAAFLHCSVIPYIPSFPACFPNLTKSLAAHAASFLPSPFLICPDRSLRARLPSSHRLFLQRRRGPRSTWRYQRVARVQELRRRMRSGWLYSLPGLRVRSSPSLIPNKRWSTVARRSILEAASLT